MNNPSEKHIDQLRLTVEAYVGRRMKTPKDFIFLSEQIFTRRKMMISPTTLKRIWGYLSENIHTRLSTLDILAEFLGYISWADFVKNHAEPDLTMQDGFFVNSTLFARDLSIGSKVEVSWMPQSLVRLLYMGEDRFLVYDSLHSVLKVDSVVRLFSVIEGQPLCLFTTEHSDEGYRIYYCGRVGGVHFTVL